MNLLLPIAILTLTAALASAFLPNLIHAALCLVLTFGGVAAIYFSLGAEFVGLVQVLVYIGAVAVLIVFTILLTRRPQEPTEPTRWWGAVIAAAVFAGLCWVILASPNSQGPHADALSVKQIGELLMGRFVWPLQALGVLLTAALIGALVLVMEDKR